MSVTREKITNFLLFIKTFFNYIEKDSNFIDNNNIDLGTFQECKKWFCYAKGVKGAILGCDIKILEEQKLELETSCQSLTKEIGDNQLENSLEYRKNNLTNEITIFLQQKEDYIKKENDIRAEIEVLQKTKDELLQEIGSNDIHGTLEYQKAELDNDIEKLKLEETKIIDELTIFTKNKVKEKQDYIVQQQKELENYKQDIERKKRQRMIYLQN